MILFYQVHQLKYACTTKLIIKKPKIKTKMTQITPFTVQGITEEVTSIAFDTYIPDEALPTIHFKYLSEKGETLLASNFMLTEEDFEQWDDTMESLKAIVLKRLGLTTLATTLI